MMNHTGTQGPEQEKLGSLKGTCPFCLADIDVHFAGPRPRQLRPLVGRAYR
jgi:hypothetical protein